MFFLRRPTRQRIRRFLRDAAAVGLSYPEAGATIAGELPAGYNVDHNRVLLGYGEAVFERACAALFAWRMFQLGWVELLHPAEPIAPGQTVAILAHTCGLYSLSASRVLSLIDEDAPAMRRRGFNYGTTLHHVERGEERFTVEHYHSDQSVWYDLLAFSQPQHPFARLGYPVSRAFQHRFAHDSKAVMQQAVAAALC